MQNRLSPADYFWNMSPIVMALRDEIKRFYPQSRAVNLKFKNMPPDGQNPKQIYGSAIAVGGYENPVLIEGFVGFSPKRCRIGYNPQDIFESFLKDQNAKGTLVASIEPCEIKGSPKHFPIVTSRGEVLRRNIRDIVTEQVEKALLFGRFHYYIKDTKVEEACRKIARQISSAIEVSSFLHR